MVLPLKDHWFNCLQDCYLSLMYHLDDIADYLNVNSTIINDIDRSFIEMELLKPIYGAITLLGLHITRPFHTLLIDPSTTYSTLMVSFKRLYKDLTEIPAKNFLTKDQAAYFVTKDIYEKSKPDECLLQFIEDSIKAFSSEIEKLIAIALPKFASSFNTQKGAIFGFGPSAELEPTGNVLKLCNTDSNTLDKLDTHVQIRNLVQERSVGCINYGLAISGEENLTTVSQRNKIKTAGDLITHCKPDNYKTYKFQAKEIKDVMKQWNEKMTVFQ